MADGTRASAKSVAEAEALVHPLLAPRRGGAEDFRSRDARLFTGQMEADRALLDPCAESIAVTAAGRWCSSSRRPASSSLELARTPADAALTPEQPQGLEVDVLHDRDGLPAFVMMTPGAVPRTYPSAGPRRRGGNGKEPSASPRGFEPLLAK